MKRGKLVVKVENQGLEEKHSSRAFYYPLYQLMLAIIQTQDLSIPNLTTGGGKVGSLFSVYESPAFKD